MKKLEGKELCAWSLGREVAEQHGLVGDCGNCKYKLGIGIYQVCSAPVEIGNGRGGMWQCVVSELHEPWPQEVGCMWCKYTFRPKTERCQECVSKPHFPRFVRRYPKED